MKTMKMILSFKRPMVVLFSVLSLLAACKKDSDSHADTDKVLTLYGIRQTEYSGSAATEELVAIDPATLTVSLIQNLNSLPDSFSMGDLVYLPTTNELVGLDDKGLRLMKINVSTKQTATFTLSTDVNNYFTDLVPDKAGNLYSIAHKVVYYPYTDNTLTKIDLATGTPTSLSAVTGGFTSLAYIPATNELISIVGGRILAKLNLTTKDTSTVEIAASGHYKHLTVDNKSNLYGYKTTNSLPYTGSLVKLDAVTGQETLLSDLNTGDPIWDHLTFVPQLNEIMGVWQQASLYRFNVGTNTQTITEISSTPDVHFFSVISN
jgi:hypothetical protein